MMLEERPLPELDSYYLGECRNYFPFSTLPANRRSHQFGSRFPRPRFLIGFTLLHPQVFEFK